MLSLDSFISVLKCCSLFFSNSFCWTFCFWHHVLVWIQSSRKRLTTSGLLCSLTFARKVYFRNSRCYHWKKHKILNKIGWFLGVLSPCNVLLKFLNIFYPFFSNKCKGLGLKGLTFWKTKTTTLSGRKMSEESDENFEGVTKFIPDE